MKITVEVLPETHAALKDCKSLGFRSAGQMIDYAVRVQQQTKEVLGKVTPDLADVVRAAVQKELGTARGAISPEAFSEMLFDFLSNARNREEVWARLRSFHDDDHLLELMDDDEARVKVHPQPSHDVAISPGPSDASPMTHEMRQRYGFPVSIPDSVERYDSAESLGFGGDD
jgi:hypothetical protein